MASTPNGNGNARALAPSKGRLDSLKAIFEKAKPSLTAVLPRHLTAEKILKITLSAASRTPDLLACTSDSILLAVMQAAQLGLEPNTPLGLSYLVPFRNRKKNAEGQWVEVMEAQFIPGYRGLVRLAVQSGEVLSVQARAVHARDVFEYEFGLEESLVHRPWVPPVLEDGAAEGGEDPLDAGPLTHVYAIAHFKNGARQFDVLTRSEVERIRRRSKSGGSDRSPWATDFEEMAKKTVLRRLCKSLPMSTETLERALGHQARAEAGEGPDFSDVIDVLPSASDAPALPAARPSATQTLKDKLATKVSVARESGSDDGDDEPPMGPGGGGAPRGHYDAADADGGASEAGGSEGSQALARSWEPVTTSEGTVIEDEDAARRYLGAHNEFKLMASYKRHAHAGWRALVVEFYARRRGCSLDLARKALRASCAPSTVTATAPALRRTGT